MANKKKNTSVRQGKKRDPNRVNLIKAILLALCGGIYLVEMETLQSRVLQILGYVFILLASMYLIRYLNIKRDNKDKRE